MEALLSFAGPQRTSISVIPASWCLSGNLAILWSHQSCLAPGSLRIRGRKHRSTWVDLSLLTRFPPSTTRGPPAPLLDIIRLATTTLNSRSLSLCPAEPCSCLVNYRVSTLTQFAQSPREWGNGSTGIGQSWGHLCSPCLWLGSLGAVVHLSQRSSPNSGAGKGCLCQTTLSFRGKALWSFFHF